MKHTDWFAVFFVSQDLAFFSACLHILHQRLMMNGYQGLGFWVNELRN